MALDHCSVADPPLITVDGLAASVNDGGTGAFTATETVRVTDPPSPVQVIANAVVLDSGPVDSLPAPARAPDQPPEAEHSVELVLLQVKLDEAPLATTDGVAASVSAGAGTTATSTSTAASLVPPGPVQLSVNLLAEVSGALL